MSSEVGPLVDPTAFERRPRPVAPRPTSLDGARVLLVDATLNKASRWGAGMVDAAARVLTAHADVTCDRADLDPLDVRPGQLWVDSVATQYDGIVLAAGDCVTCTSRAARNLVLAEGSGVPGAIICTSATGPMVRAVGVALGLPSVQVYPVSDSLFGRTREQVADLVEPHVDLLPASLTAPSAHPGPVRPSHSTEETHA